jgi:membrane-bound lytic murein transglycosylase D
MTTRKLLTATLVCNGLLMLATTAQARHLEQQPSEPIATLGTTAFSRAAGFASLHDTAAIASPDSAAAVLKIEVIKAPQIHLNPAAEKFVQDYIKKNGEVLQKVEQRSEPVFRIMEPILLKYELPVELKYLAVVESDLKRTAMSRVGAAGPWQLMPVTARELGLKVTKKWDERQHYSKSTTAAAKYLRDLYNEYEDWLLVIAAYNAGPGTVNKAIRRAGSRNFWKLQYFLPAETRGHVKRFISTHYYFEDAGGETTLTKAENAAYAKMLAQFTAAAPADTNETNALIPVVSETDSAKEVFKETGVAATLTRKDK